MRFFWPHAGLSCAGLSCAGLSCAGLAVGLLLAAAGPGRAASPVTDAFLANVMPNVDFLDRSSRMALENSKNRKLRAFALDEAREQTLAANALYDWTQAAAAPLVADAGRLDQTPTGSTPPRPIPAAAPAPDAATPDSEAPLPRGQEDLDSLEGLGGAEFDADYKTKQKDALEQVAADYVAYIAKGDDPTLLDLAKRQLPKVRKRLAALGRL